MLTSVLLFMLLNTCHLIGYTPNTYVLLNNSSLTQHLHTFSRLTVDHSYNPNGQSKFIIAKRDSCFNRLMKLLMHEQVLFLTGQRSLLMHEDLFSFCLTNFYNNLFTLNMGISHIYILIGINLKKS